MIERFTVLVINKMVEEEIVEADNIRYYEYSAVCMLESLLTIITISMIGFLCKSILQTAIFLMFFYSLRKRTGGFHAKYFWQCYLTSVALFLILNIFICPFLIKDGYNLMLVLLTVSFIYILRTGTVNHPNWDLNYQEYRESKRKARMVLLVEMVIILAAIILKVNTSLVVYMAISVVACAMLLILAKALQQEIT